MNINAKKHLNRFYLKKFKSLKITIATMLLSNLLFAQSPGWAVAENNFEYTMTLVAFLNVNNTRLSNTNDKVAAFVNDEIRGVANLTYVESENAYFAYMTIFANQNGEMLNFKIYDSENNTIVDVETTLNFNILSHQGSLSQAFSIASPKLSTQANIQDLYFQEVQVVEFSQSNNTVNLNILDTDNLGLSTVVFQLSPGANLIYNNDVLIYGVSKIDLSNSPIQVQIRSEDQSVLRNVSLQIHIIEANQPRFFRKNEVCHTRGAIKVIFNSNGTNVLLSKNGNTISESTITNSEVVFNNLEAGNYQLRIGSIIKTITINYNE